MTFLESFRRRLLDLLIPAFRIEGAGGSAYFAYASQKSAVVDGLAVCPLLDPVISRRAGEVYTYIVIGRAPAAEALPSVQLPHVLRWTEFLASALFWERSDLTDFRFLRRIFTVILCGPECNHRIHAARTFLVARYFSLKFREIAAACDRAFVISYYDAVMLGVIRAFRREGKPTWDVQHGHLGHTHDAYNNRSAFQLASSFRPAAFLVWDTHFGKYLEATLGAQWESTDYAHLKRLLTDASLVTDTPTRERQLTILYSLQPETRFPPLEAVVRKFRHVTWLFRKHPRQRSLPPEIEPIQALGNASVTAATDPLPIVLRGCSLHVTYNSSVVHEAAALGIPSVFMDPDFADRFTPEIEKGLAHFVPEERLAEALERFLGGPDAVVAPLRRAGGPAG